MRPAGKPELGQDVSQAMQQGGLFIVDRDQTVQAAAVPTRGLDDVQALQFVDDATRGHLQATLADLTLEQAVGQQG